MSSRERILQHVREHQPPAVKLPSLDIQSLQYNDPRAQFIEILTTVGGHAVEVASLAAAHDHLTQMPVYVEAKRTCVLIDGVGEGNVDLNDVRDPHELADVDLAIMPAQFGVAENGAVWFDDSSLNHRVLPFLTQHLVFVLPADQIVHTLHEAYQRLTFSEPRFGMFLSGPSKTADIEQSLVIGAHGARSLTVFLVEAGAPIP